MSSHDPDHYKVGGIESIDVIRAKLTPEQFEGFCLGNAMKYVHRAGHKGSMADDIKKAAVYLEWAGEVEYAEPVGKQLPISAYDMGVMSVMPIRGDIDMGPDRRESIERLMRHGFVYWNKADDTYRKTKDKTS